jgi:predicted enzyme related to lactoylglutathione lyase/transcriptional regulator with XRE-family HTH domain
MRSETKAPLSFQETVMTEYARRIRKNRRYSLRAFAKHLGTTHSTLSRILRGKQKPTLKLIDCVSKRLGANPKELQHWRKDISKRLMTRQLSQDLEWICMMITHLLKQSDFSPNTFWVAGKLGIPFDEVNIALSWMCSQGDLQMDGKSWRWTGTDNPGAPNEKSKNSKSNSVGYPIVHWQILSNNIKSTLEFCSRVFQWTTQSNNGLGYHEIKNLGPDSIHGGVWPLPSDQMSAVQLFVLVPDIKTAFSEALQNGAKAVIHPQNLPDGDKMAVIQDPAGVVFGLQEKK